MVFHTIHTLSRHGYFIQICGWKQLIHISLMAIFAEVTENERIIYRHLRGIHPLLDYDASESQSMISI